MFHYLVEGPKSRRNALTLSLLSTLAMLLGILGGTRLYKGHFDWPYHVVSGLASQIDNPDGYWVFCLGIGTSFLIAFPLGGFFQRGITVPNFRAVRLATLLFRVGCLCGLLVGIERGLIHNVSSVLFKSHEVIAFVAFAGVFLGVLNFAYLFARQQRNTPTAWRSWLVLGSVCLPFAASVLSQFVVYIWFRHMGWVSPSWRENGFPMLLSFAFWQWLATAGAYISLITLSALVGNNRAPQ